jgi:GPH family glycoside/pentoside/hexuronide:cation symporter
MIKMETQDAEIEHSKLDMASFGFAKFLGEFIEMAFTTWAFYFYETAIGLDSTWVGLGFIIFALWNAFNDPLMGFLTNRPFKFTKKWGRRFPWIIIGGIPYVLSYMLIFTPPTVNPASGAVILFLYLIFSTCLFDTFNSIFFINYVSLFPDKFRSSKERRLATGIQTPIGILGIAVGAIVPGLIISKMDATTYPIQAFIMSMIGLVAIILAVPGCREDQEKVDQYLEKHSEKSDRTPFFESLVRALKHSSFVIFIIGYTLYRCLVISMQSSIPYVVTFILDEPEIYVTLLSAGFLIGALISSPLWAKLAQKTNNNKRVMVISSTLMAVFTFPLAFLADPIYLLIGTTFWGVALGGYWTMISPVLSDVIDESVVQSGKREEGVYNGFLQFFGRLGLLFQALTFAIVHTLTDFPEGAETLAQLQIFSSTPQLAVLGISVHFAIIPAIVMGIGTVIFWKFYKLTPDIIEEHQAQVRKLKL